MKTWPGQFLISRYDSAIESYLCSGIQIESLEAKMSTDAEDNLQLETAVDMILKF